MIYSSLYANVTPSFRRGYHAAVRPPHGIAVLAYESQYGDAAEAPGCFPKHRDSDRLAGIARFYGNLIGVKYGEPFVVKETMRVDDVVALGVRSF